MCGYTMSKQSGNECPAPTKCAIADGRFPEKLIEGGAFKLQLVP